LLVITPVTAPVAYVAIDFIFSKESLGSGIGKTKMRASIIGHP